MAFARYFAKNAQSAALLLQGIQSDAFKQALEDQTLVIAADAAALADPEGVLLLDLLVRLGARLFPRMAIMPLGGMHRSKLRGLHQLALRINQDIEIEPAACKGARWIVAGKTPAPSDAQVVYAGSDGWLAKLSRSGPPGGGRSQNPFGAGAAACLALANVFRDIFATELPHAKRDLEVVFSTLAMAPVSKRRPMNPPIDHMDLGIVYLVGAGAIGNGFLWAMRSARVTGTLHVVDGEVLDASNLQRYAMTVERDEGKPKSQLAVTWMRTAKLRVVPHAQHWEQFVSTTDRQFQKVAVAVDTASSRIHIQASLPQRAYNTWTQMGEVGLSRHAAFEGACMACLYMPDGAALNEDQLLARALRLPEDRAVLLDIRRRIQLSVPTERLFLEQLAQRTNIPVQDVLVFENAPLRELYQRGVCGGAVLGLAQGAGQAEVPMAFQSALAGILMAADLVAEEGRLRSRLPTRTQINLLTALSMIPSNGQARHMRCFCGDPDFAEAYARKYASRPAAPRR